MARRGREVVLQVPDDNRGSSFNFAKGATILIGAAGIGIAYYYLSGKANAQNQSGQVQNDAFTQWATSLKNLIDGWTSNDEVEEMIKIAGQITDFAKVSAAYVNLTSGAILLDDISSNMDADQYQRFLTNLNKKGSQSNAKNITTKPAPVPTGLVSGVSKIFINNATKNVGLYLNSADYGTGKVSLVLGKGANLAPVTFLSAEEKTYTDARPPFTAKVYKVKMQNGKIYFIAATDIMKKALSGIDDLENSNSQLCNQLFLA